MDDVPELLDSLVSVDVVFEFSGLTYCDSHIMTTI